MTHRDAVRYFMTIPEAVQLVLQAGSMGEGGEVFLLDMGRPVRIVDLAENLIRLSGLIPGEDVSIEFIGLRPGEKLSEELLVEGEGIQPTEHDQIRVLRGHEPRDALMDDVDAVVDVAKTGDRPGVIRGLARIVPEYKPRNDVLREALEDKEGES